MKANHESKKEFFMNRTTTSSLLFQELSVSDLRNNLKHYQEKLGIKIYINGEYCLQNKWKKVDRSREKKIAAKSKELEGAEEWYREQEIKKVSILSNFKAKKKKCNVSEEIVAIQQNLSNYEFVGYIFTNGETVDPAHFEVLIISKYFTIKPVYWLVEKNMMLDKYYSMTNRCLPGMSQIMPQVNDYSCGTLGLLYLKELLKNQAEMLQHYSMAFSSGGKTYFFPPAQTLRYSQSTFYVKCITAMLGEGDKRGYVLVTHGNKTAKIKTLKALLEVNQEQNQPLLAYLDSFKQKWLEAYAEVQVKRECMRNPITNYNDYLDYRTFTIKRGTPVFKTNEEKAETIKLEEWNQIDYFINIGSDLYHVDSTGEKTQIFGADQRMLSQLSPNSLTFFDTQEIQHCLEPVKNKDTLYTRFGFFKREANETSSENTCSVTSNKSQVGSGS